MKTLDQIIDAYSEETQPLVPPKSPYVMTIDEADKALKDFGKVVQKFQLGDRVRHKDLATMELIVVRINGDNIDCRICDYGWSGAIYTLDSSELTKMHYPIMGVRHK